MRPPRKDAFELITSVQWLALLIVCLSAPASLAGLLQRSGDGPFQHITAWGVPVEIYGRGLYRYDSTLGAGESQGADALVLVAGVPLLAGATILARGGSLRAGLTLLGTLTYFTYVYATYSLKISYNPLFLVYVALFGASLWAFALHVRSFDLEVLATRFRAEMPRRLPAAFMIASGVVAAGIWLESPVRSLLTGEPPSALGASTTLVTHALDLAIIVPAAIISGVLILERQASGYVIAFSILVLESLLLPLMALQTVFQLRAGATYTVAEVVGLIGGFTVLSVGAMFVLILLLRNVTEVDDSADDRPVGG